MKHQGFSLIELIIFIVIIGIVGVALLRIFGTILQSSPSANYQTTAIALAQERMELILAKRRQSGFTSLTDPCSGSSASICINPTGYNVSANISNTTINSDNNYKTITVTVTGNGNATLTTIVGS